MNQTQKGLAQIPLVVGLLLMALGVPAAMKLGQQSTDNRSSARQVNCNKDSDCGKNMVCSNNYCVPAPKWVFNRCRAGEKACIGTKLVRECTSNGQWGLPKNCGNGMVCQKGQCVEEQKKKYQCNPNGGCVESANGEFGTLAQCQIECLKTRPSIKPNPKVSLRPTVMEKRNYECDTVSGKCGLKTGGTYSSMAQCQLNCKKETVNPKAECYSKSKEECATSTGCRWNGVTSKCVEAYRTVPTAAPKIKGPSNTPECSNLSAASCARTSGCKWSAVTRKCVGYFLY